MLGPAHAAEHALQRSRAREQEGAPAAPTAAAARDDRGRAAIAGPPAQVGRWSAPFSIPVFGIHAVMLPTGKVMWWAYPYGEDPKQDTAQAWLWDPRTGAFKRVDPPLWLDPADGQLKPANIWCSGNSLLADGRVLVTGGNLDYAGGGQSAKGLNKVYTFNPFNETWVEQPDMPHGRWYPTQTLLPDGRTLILGGLDEIGGAQNNKDVELFTPSAGRNGRGTLARIAVRGPGGPPDGGLYPHAFLMPSGRTMITGPYPSDSWLFDRIGTDERIPLGRPPRPRVPRWWGTAVIAPGGPRGSRRITLYRRLTVRAPGAGADTWPPRDERDDHRGESVLEPGAVDEHRSQPPQHRAPPGQLDGDGRRRLRHPTAQRAVRVRSPSNRRSRSTTRRRPPGDSAPPRRRDAPITRPPCSFPMAA